MGNLSRWCLGCLLALVFVTARAETIPATSNVAQTYVAWDFRSYIAASSAIQAACSAALAYKNSQGANYDLGSCVVTNSATSGLSVGTQVANARFLYHGLTEAQGGFAEQRSINVASVGYACPSGQDWTLSGSTCTRPDCAAGYDRNSAGQCVKDCTAKAGQPTTNGNYLFSGAPSTWAVSECKVYCPQRTISAYGGMGYGCKYTGVSADPNAASGAPEPPDPEKLPPEKPDDCLNKGQGYVQSSTGKITCVSSSDAPDGQKPKAKEQDGQKESGKQNADGTYDKTSPDYKKVDESVSQGSDGKTTTKRTETIAGTNDGAGNYTCPSGYTKNSDNTCSKTTVESSTNSKYCEENPNASVCKENKDSTFGGDCTGGFTCNGDAANCATAKASWELRCEFSKTSPISDFGQSLVDGHDTASLPSSHNPDVTRDLSQLGYTDTAGSCLPDLQFNMMGRSLTVPTQGICNIGGWLGNIGVALSLLIAGFIIVGGIKAT